MPRAQTAGRKGGAPQERRTSSPFALRDLSWRAKIGGGEGSRNRSAIFGMVRDDDKTSVNIGDSARGHLSTGRRFTHQTTEIFPVLSR